jgi:hypothetical protein
MAGKEQPSERMLRKHQLIQEVHSGRANRFKLREDLTSGSMTLDQFTDALFDALRADALKIQNNKTLVDPRQISLNLEFSNEGKAHIELIPVKKK